jgi:RND family efflux transporter MFP subunit
MTAYSQRNQLRSQVGVLRASGGSVAEVTLRKTEAELAAAEASLSALCEEFRFQSAQQARQAELKLKEAETALAAARTHLLILGYTEEELKKLDPAREGAAASRYEIRAPFAGTVVKRHAVRSERVGPQMEMFRIADLSTVWVEADAFEGDLPLIRALGSRGVVFRSPAAGISQRPAQLLYSGDIVDPNSRAMTVTASAPNPARELKPGMFVEVGIPRGGVKQVLQVPSSAVQRYQGKTFVFVHAKDDEFRRADVELGREGGNRVEIKSGLAAGDAVVVEGGFVLKSELLRDQLAGE